MSLNSLTSTALSWMLRAIRRRLATVSCRARDIIRSTTRRISLALTSVVRMRSYLNKAGAIALYRAMRWLRLRPSLLNPILCFIVGFLFLGYGRGLFLLHFQTGQFAQH